MADDSHAFYTARSARAGDDFSSTRTTRGAGVARRRKAVGVGATPGEVRSRRAGSRRG
ncbi:MAG: hypothetical protein ABIK65_06235 [Candidatus Eisenbacteria bacterium]